MNYNKYLSPCKTDVICKGCPVKRSCATKSSVPNCIKQFLDNGHDINDAVQRSANQAATAANTGSPKLPTLGEVLAEIRCYRKAINYNDPEIIAKIVHDFMCRQLRAGA